MIRVRGMHKAYRTGKLVNEVLRGIDLDIATGEMVSIMGPSGSGKSTLLHAIGGLDSDYTGEITVDGRNLHELGDVDLSGYRNRFVGFVFQAFYLLPHMTVLENVALPAVFARGDATLADAAIRTRAQEVLDEVELGARADSKPTTLSGGQRQRVAIARALFNRPKLMLCDEPTGNLDSKMGGQILELFRRLNRRENITVLIVTHDPKIAEATTRRLRVDDGLLLEDGVAAAPRSHTTAEDARGAGADELPGAQAISAEESP